MRSHKEKMWFLSLTGLPCEILRHKYHFPDTWIRFSVIQQTWILSVIQTGIFAQREGYTSFTTSWETLSGSFSIPSLIFAISGELIKKYKSFGYSMAEMEPFTKTVNRKGCHEFLDMATLLELSQSISCQAQLRQGQGQRQTDRLRYLFLRKC